jgi:hypothetical protein
VYELSRVRLHAVGPKGARYQDVTLDLRSGASGEPSPASVLFLENGGGKTVLVRLIFSVLLPGRRQVVGTSSSRVLDKFVLAGDVSHVSLEWRDTRTGQLLVTGKVSEWSGHVVSTDPSRLHERWYTLRPTGAFGLAELPFTSGGRIVTLSGFYDRLDEAQQADPSLQVTWEKNHGDWTEHLRRLRLDPALFGYQRRMNAGEGEAADAFTFKTDEAFVDWLLTAILPPDEPAGLGELVSEYSTQLASRGELMTERTFVEGTLERLEPLVRWAGEQAAAVTMHRDAYLDVERFALALTAREELESGRVSLLKSRQGQTAAREHRADLEVDRLNKIVLELQRLVAKLRWDEAQAERARKQRELDAARELLDAWQATDVLVRYSVAHQEAEVIREIVRKAESDAAPLLSARDDAARRFARKLLAVASAADEAANGAERRAAQVTEEIGQASQQRDQAIHEAEGAMARIEHLTELVATVQATIREAMAAGLLAETEDVSVAADVAQEAATTAESAVTSVLEEAGELAAQREQLQADHGDARTRVETSARTAERLAEQRAAAERAAAALTAVDRLQGLLGSDEIDLDSDAQVLIDLLGQAIGDNAVERDELGLARQRDQRVLDALGDGGLLPAADPVLDALAVLRHAGITAWTGWEYLSRIPADERDDVIARHPSLVDGIVLNRENDIDQAAAMLREARLLPRTVIAVGTSADITDESSDSPAGIEFIVPPNPALFDADRAEAERRQLQGRQDERRALLAQLNEVIDSDQRLRSRLVEWQADFPPGRMAEFAAEAATAAAALADAREHEQALRATLADVVSREKAIREQVPRLRAQAAAAQQRADRLGALATENARVPNWQADMRAQRNFRARAVEEAARQRERGEALGRRQRDLDREADGQRRTAASLRDELAGVVGGGSVSDSYPAPPDNLEALRTGYRAAVDAYQRAEVGTDLLAREERLGKDESAARAVVAALDNHVHGHAARLLLTPEGSDAAARAEVVARATRRVGDLGAEVTAAAEHAARLQTSYLGFQPQERSLEPYGKPESIPHGEQLIERASSDWDTAKAELDEARDHLAALDEKLTEARNLAGGFETVLETLTHLLPAPAEGEASPFDGSVDAARSRRDSVRNTLGEARRLLDEASGHVRQAAAALARHAADERFDRLATPVKRLLNATAQDRMAEFAAEWEAALRPRFRVLNDELEQIERHRAVIVERLQGMVTRALGRLRAAQRASRLPADLEDWSGLEFLRISFAQPEDAVLAERLGQLIDEVTAPVLAGKTPAKRDGMSILLSGVKGAMAPKGVRVEILKPDAVLRDERIRVGEIGDVFSGGQLLTTAIIMYCTMAWLRAGERGHTQRQHAGVLFLDNPIGRASAGYLLALQLTVARKLGVQLIYTTGLFDTNALSVFPLIVRLRNDLDLRAGMKYLRVDEAIRPHLPTEPADDMALITTSRVFSRPGNMDRSA